MLPDALVRAKETTTGERVRAHVGLPIELVTCFDERAGSRRRGEGVAETLRKELDRQHLLNLAEAAASEARRLSNGGGGRVVDFGRRLRLDAGAASGRHRRCLLQGMNGVGRYLMDTDVVIDSS